jgi:hypothetical protein
MSHQSKSAAQMSQNFDHTLFISDYNVTPSEICGMHGAEFPLYSLFGDVEGWGYIVYQYIAYLGMEKGGVTLYVRRSTSVSQTNGILRHECCRISIIHCILVTTII